MTMLLLLLNLSYVCRIDERKCTDLLFAAILVPFVVTMLLLFLVLLLLLSLLLAHTLSFR